MLLLRIAAAAAAGLAALVGLRLLGLVRLGLLGLVRLARAAFSTTAGDHGGSVDGVGGELIEDALLHFDLCFSV